MENTLPKLPLTPKQVADIYGLSPEIVLREIHSGRLKGRHKRGESRKWYITEAAIREWVESGMLEDDEPL